MLERSMLHLLCFSLDLVASPKFSKEKISSLAVKFLTSSNLFDTPLTSFLLCKPDCFGRRAIGLVKEAFLAKLSCFVILRLNLLLWIGFPTMDDVAFVDSIVPLEGEPPLLLGGEWDFTAFIVALMRDFFISTSFCRSLTLALQDSKENVLNFIPLRILSFKNSGDGSKTRSEISNFLM